MSNHFFMAVSVLPVYYTVSFFPKWRLGDCSERNAFYLFNRKLILAQRWKWHDWTDKAYSYRTLSLFTDEDQAHKISPQSVLMGTNKLFSEVMNSLSGKW